MITITPSGYNLKIFENQPVPNKLVVLDHLGGFDSSFNNDILTKINAMALPGTQVEVSYIIEPYIADNYSNLQLTKKRWPMFDSLQLYNTHPELNYKNFVCSFNGSEHVSRKFLVSILKKFGYFNPDYCSKNFSYTTNKLDGHIYDYVSNDIEFYRKFFISNNSEDFFQSIKSFGHVKFDQFDHDKNIYNLENKLTESFLHLVSETMATSYVPFVTEKFLYSVITHGLFLAYAQPGWHNHVEKYYGFKRYTKLFDYRFDSIQNPVERLVELMTMISKFSVLSSADWKDLYQLEADTIEYNYDHYFSGNYLEHLKKYESIK